MPLLLGHGEKVFAAHGTMGGYGQPQIHAQLLLRIAAGEQPGPALAEPRWVVGRPDDGGPLRAYVERSVPGPARESIAAHGLPIHALPDLDAEVGHAQLVRRTVGDGLVAASDPRAEGVRRE